MSPKDSRNHTVLGVQQFKPAEFAQQMNLNMDNAWGILRCILDIVKKLDDGKYLIMKDPNKVSISLCWLLVGVYIANGYGTWFLAGM